MGTASLEADGSLPTACGCWEAGGTWPFSVLSSPVVLAPARPELPLALLANRAVLPRSVDRRVSFCRRADLKKDSPLSSDLLSLFRPERVPVPGERRLAMELLRTCLASPRPSPARAWLPRGEVGLELEVRLPRSEVRLCLEPSRLRLHSEVLLFPGGHEARGAGLEAFLVGVEAGEWARAAADLGF